MRMAVGSIMHESNTFAAGLTPLADFAPVEGEDVFRSDSWLKESSAGGILSVLGQNGVEIVPALFARALPSPTVSKDAYLSMKSSLLRALKQAGNLDGVALGLHGSMTVEDLGDAEGDLLAEIRGVVGSEIPVVCALDMHATVTDAMMQNADAFVAYRTAPHVDEFGTGERAAEILMKAATSGCRPVTARVHIPMLLAGEQSETDKEPMSQLVAALQETDRQPGIVSSSFTLGFPWADVPYNGVGALVVACGDPALAEKEALRLADLFWRKRTLFNFTTEAHLLDDALNVAASAAFNEETLSSGRKPIIVSDSGDNPTAGAAEDLAIALQAILAKHVSGVRVLVAVIADVRSYEECAEVGAGARVRLRLGRTGPEPQAAPLDVTVHVQRLGMSEGVKAALVSADAVDIIITDKRVAVTNPAFLTALSVDPAAYGMLVIKSGYVSPEYQRLARKCILALTPGDTNELLSELPFARVPRPCYPLDPDMSWIPSAAARP